MKVKTSYKVHQTSEKAVVFCLAMKTLHISFVSDASSKTNGPTFLKLRQDLWKATCVHFMKL